MMDDLVDWLRLQLDEDERKATDGQRAGLDDDWPFWIDRDDDWDFEAAEAYRDHFKPARVLRDVQAKRRIVEVAVSRHKASVVLPAGHREASAVSAIAVLQFLAFPYSDRPGFRDDWRV
jgi:hypothetical protein